MAFTLRRHIGTVAFTAALAALTLPVLAQPTPVPASAEANATANGPRQAGERPMHHRHADKKDGQTRDWGIYRAERMAQLKTKLQLTAAQEPAWTTFTSAMQPGERTARLDRAGMEKLSTPERIDRMRALRAQHAAEADRRGEATKTFYATLAPAQQKTFDDQPLRGHRMGRMRDGMSGSKEGHHAHGGQSGHHGMHGSGMPMSAPAK